MLPNPVTRRGGVTLSVTAIGVPERGAGRRRRVGSYIRARPSRPCSLEATPTRPATPAPHVAAPRVTIVRLNRNSRSRYGCDQKSDPCRTPPHAKYLHHPRTLIPLAFRAVPSVQTAPFLDRSSTCRHRPIQACCPDRARRCCACGCSTALLAIPKISCAHTAHLSLLRRSTGSCIMRA